MCHYKVEVRLMLSWSAFRCCSKSSNMMRHLLPVCAWKTWGRTYHMILIFSIIFLSMCHPLQGRSGCTWLSWYHLDAALNNEVQICSYIHIHIQLIEKFWMKKSVSSYMYAPIGSPPVVKCDHWAFCTGCFGRNPSHHSWWVYAPCHQLHYILAEQAHVLHYFGATTCVHFYSTCLKDVHWDIHAWFIWVSCQLLSGCKCFSLHLYKGLHGWPSP